MKELAVHILIRVVSSSKEIVRSVKALTRGGTDEVEGNMLSVVSSYYCLKYCRYRCVSKSLLYCPICFRFYHKIYCHSI
jgi:hypothetical protein